MSEQTILPVQVVEDQEVELAIKQPNPKLVEQARQKYADTKALEAIGVKVRKLKLSSCRILKPHLDKIGVKTIGHCRILIGSEKAEEYLDALDARAKELADAGKLSVDTMLAIEELKIELVKVIIQSGSEYLRAERQAADQMPAQGGSMTFPVGTPVAVMVGQGKTQVPAPN